MFREKSLIAAILGAAIFASPLAAGETFSLLTPEMLAAYRDTPPSATRGLTLTRADGPVIKVHSPRQSSLAAPVLFDIEFQPKDGVPPSLQTLKIDYRLGPIWYNVTKKLVANATFRGTRLSATGADLPAGRHHMRLSISDSKGRVTAADVKFSVTK